MPSVATSRRTLTSLLFRILTGTSILWPNVTPPYLILKLYIKCNAVQCNIVTIQDQRIQYRIQCSIIHLMNEFTLLIIINKFYRLKPKYATKSWRKTKKDSVNTNNLERKLKRNFIFRLCRQLSLLRDNISTPKLLFQCCWYFMDTQSVHGDEYAHIKNQVITFSYEILWLFLEDNHYNPWVWYYTRYLQYLSALQVVYIYNIYQNTLQHQSYTNMTWDIVMNEGL